MIIISDIHGEIKTLKALLAQIPEEEKAKGIACCGDLIDRGSNSKEVVQFMIDNNIMCVRGNHEDFMIQEWDKHLGMNNIWIYNGGYQALKSYNIPNFEVKGNSPEAKLFREHVKWMESLPIYLEFPDVKDVKGRQLLVTHSSAGYAWNAVDGDPSKLTDRLKEDILWGRRNYIHPIDGIFNVFGHTPQEHKPTITKYYANIDCGAVFKHYKVHGVMAALNFPELKVYTQENIDD